MTREKISLSAELGRYLLAFGAGPMTPAINNSMPAHVVAAFKEFPAPVRKRLEYVRALIFSIAAKDQNIGSLTETLKWGEPAYLTEATRSGSTIRLGWPKAHPNHAAIYFNCQTTLVPAFRENLPNAFEYSGSRAILLAADDPVDEDVLSFCISMALTYHRTKMPHPSRNVRGRQRASLPSATTNKVSHRSWE